MKIDFNKHSGSDIMDEIVRAKLFADYNNLDAYDEPEEMREAYELVLRYITKASDKRLEMFDKVL